MEGTLGAHLQDVGAVVELGRDGEAVVLRRPEVKRRGTDKLPTESPDLWRHQQMQDSGQWGSTLEWRPKLQRILCQRQNRFPRVGGE